MLNLFPKIPLICCDNLGGGRFEGVYFSLKFFYADKLINYSHNKKGYYCYNHCKKKFCFLLFIHVFTSFEIKYLFFICSFLF